MTLDKGYTFTKVKTSHGPDMYVTRYGKLVRIVPCSPQVEISEKYANDLIRQIEAME
jgi:predicted RNA binding protein YcfA (HicA-like mRNA interferase family)